MGAKVAQVRREALTYHTKDDPAPFFDFQSGGSIIPEDLQNKEYKAFESFFLHLFPKPHDAEVELCETEAHHNQYLRQARAGRNPYMKWVFQCWAHIKKGYRVGIPYLKNTPSVAKQYEKNCAPPLRYQHKWNTTKGLPSYLGTTILSGVIRSVMAKGNVSNDVCNRFFDAMIYDYAMTPEYQKETQTFMHLLDQSKTFNNLSVVDMTLNADQNDTSNDILSPYLKPSPSTTKILALWGKKGHMKKAFPTMWYGFRDNLYGDGSKTDPDPFIFGFPRFHESFVPNEIINRYDADGYQNVDPSKYLYFPIGFPKSHTMPSDKILHDTKQFQERFMAETTSVHFSIARQKDITAWVSTENRWNDMRKYLLDECPDILFFYYLEWSQLEANQHIAYSTITVFLIYQKMANWIQGSSQKDLVVKWKDKKESKPSSIPKFEWLKPNQTVEQRDGYDRLIQKFTRNNNDQITVITYKSDGTELSKSVFDLEKKVAISTNPKGDKTVLIEHPDGASTEDVYEKDEKTSSIEYDKSGQEIIMLDETWQIPSSYGTRMVNPQLLITPQMLLVREAWKNSHSTAFGPGLDWIHDSKILPTSFDLPVPMGKMTDLPPTEYIKHVFNFIKEHPLPKPRMPSVFEDPKYRNKAGKLFGGVIPRSLWEKACDVQWTFYLIWVEANVNAHGNPGYVKPGEVITTNAQGLPVTNQIPDTGILAPYEGYEDIATLGHILFLPWTILFGDEWWTQLLGILTKGFDFCIKKLREFWNNVILPNLPAIGGTAFLIGAVVLLAYGATQFVGEKARHAAS